MRSNKCLVILILIVVILGGIILYAPRFLLYSSKYEKANAIILFLGPDFNSRQKEAYRLINDGMAKYLIIPAYHKTYRIYDKGTMKYLSPNLSSLKSGKKNVAATQRFYEDTHWEIIEAKKIMSSYGLKSAIFISSPYHMRRIKLIVMKVFATDKDDFYFVPTRYEKAPTNFWELSLADWKKVGKEYGKILWFFLYVTWSE